MRGGGRFVHQAHGRRVLLKDRGHANSPAAARAGFCKRRWTSCATSTCIARLHAALHAAGSAGSSSASRCRRTSSPIKKGLPPPSTCRRSRAAPGQSAASFTPPAPPALVARGRPRLAPGAAGPQAQGLQPAGQLQVGHQLLRRARQLGAAGSSPPAQPAVMRQQGQPPSVAPSHHCRSSTTSSGASCSKARTRASVSRAGGQRVQRRQGLVRRQLGHQARQIQPVGPQAAEGVGQRALQLGGCWRSASSTGAVGQAVQPAQAAQHRAARKGRRQQRALPAPGSPSTTTAGGRRRCSAASSASRPGRSERQWTAPPRELGRALYWALYLALCSALARPRAASGPAGVAALPCATLEALVAAQMPALQPGARVLGRGGGVVQRHEVAGAVSRIAMALGLQALGAPCCQHAVRARCRLMRKWCRASSGVASGQKTAASCSRAPAALGGQHHQQGGGHGEWQRLSGLTGRVPTGWCSKWSIAGECR